MARVSRRRVCRNRDGFVAHLSLSSADWNGQSYLALNVSIQLPSPDLPDRGVEASEPERTDFSRFYRATLQPLRNYLLRFLGDSHEAQDVAQDAYLRTYTVMQSQSVDRPGAFLYTTARRLALNFRSRRGLRMQPTDAAFIEAHAGMTPDTAEVVMGIQEMEALDAAVLALPPGCQQVLVLRLKHGLSHAEIAAKLNLAPSTVGNQLTRALRLLRIQLRPETHTSARPA